MQRKSTKNTRGPNAEEKRFHKWIKEECGRCAACLSRMPLILHHCEGATFKHNKILVGHWFTIGLCEYCDDIVTRGSRKSFREKFGPQSECWENQVFKYISHKKEQPPEEVFNAIMDWGR